jgi:hypothetical protein
MIVAFRRPPVEKHLRRLRAGAQYSSFAGTPRQYGEIDY